MVLGIDFADEYIAVKIQGTEEASVFPSVICREKRDDFWCIGEDAFRRALAGQGVITDKLLKLLQRDGTSTVYHRSYRAVELVGKLFRLVMESTLRTGDFSGVSHVTAAVHLPDGELMDKVSAALELAGIPRNKQTVITHEEAFVHYVLAREKDFAGSAVELFDLSGERLSCYEFMMIRGAGRKACVAEGEDLEEGFHTDILKKDSGRELGDKIMTDVAKRRMEGRNFSAVLLTGAGFERTDWAGSFLTFICQRRRVVQENGLFAVGACLLAEKAEQSVKEECLIFCNSRISSEISLPVCVHERETRLVLASAGERWYGLKVHVELIPKEQDWVELAVENFDIRKQKTAVRVGLEGFPERPDRMTRIALDLKFRGADRACLNICDMGFGELYPATDKKLSEEIRL